MGPLVRWHGNFWESKRTNCVLGRMPAGHSYDCWGLRDQRGLSIPTNRRSVGLQIGIWTNRWGLIGGSTEPGSEGVSLLYPNFIVQKKKPSHCIWSVAERYSCTGYLQTHVVHMLLKIQKQTQTTILVVLPIINWLVKKIMVNHTRIKSPINRIYISKLIWSFPKKNSYGLNIFQKP